jgi:hypothetical protein
MSIPSKGQAMPESRWRRREAARTREAGAVGSRLAALVGLALGAAAFAGCEGGAGGVTVVTASASAVADAQGDAAPKGTQCTVDADCAAGAWCADGWCRECDADADCDDGAGCTVDRCEADGKCASVVIDGCCAEGASADELAESCGPPPGGVAPDEYWECTPTGECAVIGAMSALALPPAGYGQAGDGAEALPGAGVAVAGTASPTTYTLPAPEAGVWSEEPWLLLMACSGCVNPGGMNKRVNGSVCSSDTTCLSGKCDMGVGLCVPWKGQGNGCDWQDECLSGFCANGFCCDTDCSGACDYCALSGQEGTCGNGCQLDSWRSEVQAAAVYAQSVPQDLTVLVNVGWHPGGRTTPGGLDTHVMDWGIINAGYGECMGGPEAERCDNEDNDCDGFIDEDWTVGPGILGAACTVGAGAVCEAHGYWVCPEGGLGTEPVCSAVPYNVGVETCNALDDDCDGDIDEDVTQACASDCGTGTETCVAGGWVDCDAPTPADFPNYGAPCDGLDADLCENGTYGCVAGPGFVCIEDPLGSIAEDCSTPEDDDCNGTNNDQDAVGCVDFYTDVDGDGFGVASTACFCAPSGLFRATETDDCNDGDDTIYPGAPEACNGIDNDCDLIGDEREPSDAVGVASYENGAMTPGHPCLGATSVGGSDCNTSSCLCGPNGGGTWGCFLD